MRLFSTSRAEGRPVTERRERLQFDGESEMEALLHANPELLLDELVFVFSRQPRLDPGLPDLVALDQYGNVVVFELKKGLSGTGSASGNCGLKRNSSRTASRTSPTESTTRHRTNAYSC